MSQSNPKADLKRAQELFADPLWRLNNLYYIIDKSGQKVKFTLNWAQAKLYEERWYLNIILKARQLGVSTYVCMLFLDRCLFNSNVTAGIIAHTREDAEHMFKRIKFAYDNLPEALKAARQANVESARELVFNNHSGIRVGTSMRSATLQYLHVSEFGKICAHYPDKAREIRTGSLNTIGTNQYIFIESTAEGRGGDFYDMCKASEALQDAGKQLSNQDYKFHFFAWHQCPDYVLDGDYTIPKLFDDYFAQLADRDIKLTKEQKNWYFKKSLTQKDDMKREYPSYPDEAFESANEASWYGKWLQEARFQGRVTNVPWDRETKVFTAWDIGYGDATAIIWFQIVGQEVHIIDYYENSGEALPFYLKVIKDRPYIYEHHFGPHDMKAHEFSSGFSRQEVAQSLGVPFIILESLKIGFDEGIEAARNMFPRFWIDEKRCSPLIKCMENYRKEWDPNYECYKDKPVHDKYSHGADALRYLAIAVKKHLDANKVTMSDQSAEDMYNKYHPLFE